MSAGSGSLEPGTVEPLASTAGTFLGMKDEILLERMHSVQVVHAKLNKGGSSVSFRLDFADGSRAAFKPEQIHPQTIPRKEIAAYRLNRLLELNAVPPATGRTFHRSELVDNLPPDMPRLARRVNAETIFDKEGFTRGEVSFWIPVILESGLDKPEHLADWQRWLTAGESIPSSRSHLMEQLSSLLLFDMLTNNPDRFSGGNLKMSDDGRMLFYMDNTFSFQSEPQGHVKCRVALAHSQKFSRSLVERLRRLDMISLRAAFEPEPGILSETEMSAILGRRDVAVAYIDRLIASNGEERVLVFE